MTHAGVGSFRDAAHGPRRKRWRRAPAKAAVAAGDGTVLLFDLTEGVPTIA